MDMSKTQTSLTKRGNDFLISLYGTIMKKHLAGINPFYAEFPCKQLGAI